MAAIVGKDCMVTLGTSKIIGMGTWKIEGITTEMHDKSQFCEEFKTYLCGIKDGGAVSFNGWYDKTDTTGQTAIRTANLKCSCLTDIRFYLSCTTGGSRWMPCAVGMTGSGHTASCIRITSWDIGADKGGLVECSFTGTVEGNMELQ